MVSEVPIQSVDLAALGQGQKQKKEEEEKKEEEGKEEEEGGEEEEARVP